MRIAYHYGSLAAGGVERRLGDLYRHLTRRGDWLEERQAMRAYLAEHRSAAKQIAKVRAFYEEVLG